jgi:hypothetical protein
MLELWYSVIIKFTAWRKRNIAKKTRPHIYK